MISEDGYNTRCQMGQCALDPILVARVVPEHPVFQFSQPLNQILERLAILLTPICLNSDWSGRCKSCCRGHLAKAVRPVSFPNTE